MTTPQASAPEVLDESTCWELLATTDLGRIAISTAEGPDIFPINFLVKDREIFFSSAPGTKLVELTAEPVVAFEADGVHDRKRWSVVVRGGATRLSFDADITAAGVHELATMTATDKWNYVRIAPTSITGRRFSALRHLS
ncbi:MAG: pyridoxamine 5'-phosphate oxidase family protein [Salinibacterium sp.]|nr:pyridoxamine 5'-phosphate oxidase family protein [Salinibacterium sp.]